MNFNLSFLSFLTHFGQIQHWYIIRLNRRPCENHWWDIIKLRHLDSLECIEWLFDDPSQGPQIWTGERIWNEVSSWLNFYRVWTRLLVLVSPHLLNTTIIPFTPPGGSLLDPQACHRELMAGAGLFLLMLLELGLCSFCSILLNSTPHLRLLKILSSLQSILPTCYKHFAAWVIHSLLLWSWLWSCSFSLVLVFHLAFYLAQGKHLDDINGRATMTSELEWCSEKDAEIRNTCILYAMFHKFLIS